MLRGKLLKWMVGAGLVVAMMGAEDPACEAERKDPSKRPAEEQQVDPKKMRMVTVSVHGNGPYTLVRVVTGPTDKGGVATEKQTTEVAGGEHKAGYQYETGGDLNVKVQVFGHAKDTFDCEIIDAGVRNNKDGTPGNRSYDRGKAQAYCEIWTQG